MAGGTVVGLDIGSSLIKVVEMKRSGGGVEVTALDIAPTPSEAFANYEIIDPQLLGKAVKELLSKARITAKRVVTSLSGQMAVVRVIDIPQLQGKELADTMRYEVERQVPFGTSQVVMDYQKVDRPEGYAEGQNMDVLMAVAREDLVNRHVDVLFSAGLKPAAIDVEPLAAGRAILELGNGVSSDPGHTVVIVNIGANNTDILIYRDRLIAFPRNLPIAGENFTRAIADYMQVDMATAENYKREFAEVLMGQATQPAGFDPGGFGSPFGGATVGAGGFMDFSQPAQAPPLDAGTSPSGRMPFDFSSPGDAPPPAPAAPTPFDMSGQSGPIPSEELEEARQQAGISSAPDMSASGFFMPPTAPTQSDNLPVAMDTSSEKDQIRIAVYNAIAPLLVELSQELKRSIDYYRGRAGDTPIHEILLVGGSAKIKNLAPYLEAEVGIPTRVFNPLQNVQVSTKNYSAGHLEEIGTLFPVSVGLGAYDLLAAPRPASKKRK
jgi:type IV pilus assembly protein PilM